jgi:hypothetical protein
LIAALLLGGRVQIWGRHTAPRHRQAAPCGGSCGHAMRSLSAIAVWSRAPPMAWRHLWRRFDGPTPGASQRARLAAGQPQNFSAT